MLPFIAFKIIKSLIRKLTNETNLKGLILETYFTFLVIYKQLKYFKQM